MEDSALLKKENFSFLIYHFNDKLKIIADSIQKNHDTLENVINKTQELHMDSISLLLGIINEKNSKIMEEKEKAFQEKAERSNDLHKKELETMKSMYQQQLKERDKIIAERDRKIRDIENKITTVNKLFNNGHENYFKTFIRNGDGQVVGNYI